MSREESFGRHVVDALEKGRITTVVRNGIPAVLITPVLPLRDQEPIPVELFGEDPADEPVTGSGPCHGEACRHVSHAAAADVPLVTNTLGRLAHDAYARVMDQPLSPHGFDTLSERVREAWRAAAAAVVADVRP